jgi:lauroyl/myristoyl acyltransferase
MLDSKIGSPKWNSLVTVQGLEHLETTMKSGRGAIFLGTHSPIGVIINKFLAQMYAVVQPVGAKQYLEFMADFSAAGRQPPAEVSASARAAAAWNAHQNLLNGGAAIIMGDEHNPTSGRPVTIGGRTYLLVGFAELAINSGAILHPYSTTMLPDGCHRLSIHKPITWERRSVRQVQIEQILESFAAYLNRTWKETPSAVLHQIMRQHQRIPLARSVQTTDHEMGKDVR